MDVTPVSRTLIFNLRNRLGDELSRRLFDSRLTFYLTGNPEYFSYVAMDAVITTFPNPVAIFGCGGFGQFLAECLRNLVCFIDNDAENKKTHFPLPIVSLDDFVEQYPGVDIIIGTIDYYDEIKRQLNSRGIKEQPLPKWAEHIRQRQKLGTPWIQYFDLPYLPHEEEELFIDGGCLDGATSLDFIRWCKASPTTKNCRIIAFEPSPVMAKVCEKALAPTGVPARVIQKGLAETSHKLKFDVSSAQPHMAAIRGTGDTDVETVALDDILPDEKVTFVKLDIEGFEMAALQGMRHCIQKHRPKMAVSVYHRPQDIVEIQSYLATLRDDYTFYLRHYSYNLYELVLYAI